MEQAGSVFRISRRAMILTGVLVIVFLCGLVLGYRYLHLLRCEERARENSIAIQFAIEQWRVNQQPSNPPGDCPIPLDLNEYVRLGYLAGIPINPFTGEPLELIAFGETPSPGNITLLQGKEYFHQVGEPSLLLNTGYFIIP